MTSADVAFSINRCKNLQGNPSFICDTIDSIEKRMITQLFSI